VANCLLFEGFLTNILQCVEKFVFGELPYPELGSFGNSFTMPMLISLEHAHIKWLQNTTGMGDKKEADNIIIFANRSNTVLTSLFT
jgi:hypothetical protein